MFALTDRPIDVAAIQSAVVHPSCGAVLLFLGTARDTFDGRGVHHLEYEAWPDLAIPALQAIGAAIADRWPGARSAIVHRLGAVPLTEPTVVSATGTPNRAACYEANRFAIEQLKVTVPIWKKEIYSDGSAWKANAKAT